MERESQSILDVLLNLMPELRDKGLTKDRLVSESSANKLFDLWKHEGHKVAKNTYRRPKEFPLNDIEDMQKEDLIRYTGDSIHITAKGSEVIKTMILGDERSSFDPPEKDLNYMTALANTKSGNRKHINAKDKDKVDRVDFESLFWNNVK